MLHKYSTSPDRYMLLREYARENRANMTEAERVLWNRINNRQLGHQFLRQYPIFDYIVDFICRDDGLIIEVDGAYHCERQQMEDDANRQCVLESYGYHFLRFTNEEVMFDTDNVIQKIEQYFE
ncbi:MAG: endonuclease domain-containing protein [Bacteroidales bacterium]|nr:endonuclease domain-containing protein [Candidatus Colicola coprequi]